MYFPHKLSNEELGYSGSAAMRRVEAARLLRAVPAVAEQIQEGALNLSQIGELSRSIKEKERTTGIKVTGLQKEALVFKIARKTTLETQKELARALDISLKEFEKQKMQKDESLRLELTFSKEQYQKLLACRDLAAHLLERNQSDSSWAFVFEVLADQYLAKKISLRTKNKNDNKKEHNNKTETLNTKNSKRNTKEEGHLERRNKAESEPELKLKCTPVPIVEFQSETQFITELSSSKSLKSTTASVLRPVNKTLNLKTR